MSKKLWTAIISLFVILLTLFLLLSKWARNPYGLEPERLGPGRKKLSQAVTIEPNAKNYLLHEYLNDPGYVIHIALPNHYIHPSNTTQKISNTYGLSAKMYYPGMNGKFHEENKHLPECNGWCNGNVSAYLQIDRRNARTITLEKLERLARDRGNKDRLLSFEDLEPIFDFDQRFQVRYPEIEKKGDKSSTDEHFIKKDKKGIPEYLFECSPYVPSPSCSVIFNSSSRSELLVELTFSMDLLGEWKQVIDAADKQISSWPSKKIETIKQ